MSPSSHYPSARPTLGTAITKSLTRVMLGWFLLHQGWGKVMQEVSGGPGSFYHGNQFQNSNPDWLPAFVAAPYGYVLPWVELVFGALLMVGIWNRISAGVSFLIFFSILVAWLDAGNLLPRHMLMIYTPLAAWYFFAGPGRFSVDGWMAGRKRGGRGLET
jgi:uncharacterized membrane protein YphA (DoxX/SURF4 family)